MISGKALERYYYQFTGNRKVFKEINALAESKVDPTAQKTIQRLVKYFGLALSTVINILDPDVVVIGGGVGNVDFLYDLGVESVRQHVFNPDMGTPIVKPYLGDSAGVLGAALLSL
jgi:predicted NBD/HSP70 family sugar kinase